MKKLCVFLTSLLLVCVQMVQAQTVRITGTVTSSEDGMPLPGVSVVVKGTTIGVTTNTDGKYEINAPTNAEALTFSFVGYKTQEIAPAGRAIINVVMETESVEMKEVVVTGLGMPTDRRKVAISVETVTDKALTKVPTTSLDAALIGRIAGASIQSTSGQPGQQANIILRGINTLTSTQPMILVDGIQISTSEGFNGSGNFSSRFADLDLSNVERVEVVQGAAAATIYGAQGANGVIQIFTKKGKKGEKTNISFNSSVAINNALTGNFDVAKHHYYQTNAEGYILASGTTDSIAPDPETGYWTLPDETFDKTTINNKLFKEKTYNHLNQYFKKNTATYNTNLNISGASEKSDYSLTFSNMNQHSPVNGYYNKNNISANVGTELFKNLTLRSSTQLIISQNTTGGINNSNDVNSGMGNVINIPSYIDLKFKDAAGNYPVNYDPNDNGILPFYSYANRKYSSRVNRVIQGINVNYKIIKFVELDWKFGYDQYRYDFSDFIRNQTYTNTPGVGIDPITGSLFKRNAWERFMNSVASAFIRFDFEKDFGLNFPLQSTTQVAYDWRQNDYERVDAQGSGFALSPPYTLSTASEYTAGDFISKFVSFGYLVNQKFDYGTFGGFSVGFRSDYSSEFGKGSKPFTFPRADAYLRISDLLKIERIYELKLRTAYGEAGIQPDRYSRLVTMNSSPISGESALYLPAIARNPELNVELSKEFEVGLDFGVNLLEGSFLSKVSGSTSYWTRKSTGSIWDIDVAPSTGATQLKTNAIDLSSKGLQLSLDVNVINTHNFEWHFGTRFSTTKTIVDKISNGLPIVVGSSGSGQTVIKEGYAVGAFFGTEPLTSIGQKDPDGNYYIDQATAGDYEIVNGYVTDTENKTVIFTTDQRQIGDATPDFSVSFFNDFTILKDVTFSFQIDWIKGAQAYNQTNQWLYRDRISQDFDKKITIGGDNQAWVNWWSSLYQTNNPNKHFVEDASFIRLRNISISWDLTRLVKSKSIKGLVLTATGRNIFTISKYSGLDPEAVGTKVNDPLQRGIDLYSFPNFRTFSFGLNVNF